MKIIKKIDGYNRVTIPMPVRELLSVSAGMDVEFILEDGRVWMRVPQEEETKSRKHIAAEVLREYGYAVPGELLDED